MSLSAGNVNHCLLSTGWWSLGSHSDDKCPIWCPGSLFCLLLAVYPWDITGHSPFERPQDRIGAAPHLIYPGYPVGAGKSTGTLLTTAILCPTGEKTKRTPK